MGLTKQTTSACTAEEALFIERTEKSDKIIALAGNPNVGKSTVFNALTGLNQHTGNWPGKTVSNAQGEFVFEGNRYILVDVPGTYSLSASSVEEEVARDFICFGNIDAVLVVADATCLERNLNLVLQILEARKNVILCVNLLDEAKKKKISIDLTSLENSLGIPVIGAAARDGEGLNDLTSAIANATHDKSVGDTAYVRYTEEIENALDALIPLINPYINSDLSARWVALSLLNADDKLRDAMAAHLGIDLLSIPEIQNVISTAFAEPRSNTKICDIIVSSIVQTAEKIYNDCVVCTDENCNKRDRYLDKLFTSRLTGIPIMLALLGIVFWLTITGANYPSALLSKLFFSFQDVLSNFFIYLNAPDWLHSVLVFGVYRTVSWVVSVMLPPMAIFFPLFTLLEDSGYLPRIAFNLDSFFRKACAHGKQALTTCMGFGCNACGVIGCRIIDSPRERLIAILTNNFVPCNGRFPTLIAIITMFFAVFSSPALNSFFSALILLSVIVLGVALTLIISKLLSKTILRGMPSSFALELPPYRRPQIGKVIVRSIFDRTLFVLGRAVSVAAPAGLVIWCFANITVGGASILAHCTGFLDPFARILGLDGVILMAFILGFPANEIVFPLILMSYLSTTTLTDFSSLSELHALLIANGWTIKTAVCTMLFSLLHFPCATTCLTIKKETGSLKWTLLAIALPTLCGMIICALINLI